MAIIKRSVVVPYSAEQMYTMVNDIGSYPEYIDGVSAASVLAKEEDYLEARLEISKGGFNQAFVTRNRLNPPMDIHMSLVEGPFKRLEGHWHFEPMGEHGCEVSLVLDFEFKSRLLGLAGGKVLDKVADGLVNGLQQQARERLGSA